MSLVSFDVPDGVFAALRRDPASLAREVRVEAAARWYADGRLSQGRAAELAGVSRREFLALLAERRIEVFTVDPADLEAEIRRG